MRAGELTFSLDLVLPQGELPRAQLQRFLTAIPETAVIKTDVTVTAKDRPWDSDLATVTLHATWLAE
jgi:hypothetical protein